MPAPQVALLDAPVVPEAQSEDAFRQTELVPAGVPVPSLKGNAYPPFPSVDQFAGVNARPPLGHEAGAVAVVGEHVGATSLDAPEEAPLPPPDAEPDKKPLVVPEPDPAEEPLVVFDPDPLPEEDPLCSPDCDPPREGGSPLHAAFATTAAMEPKASQETPKRSLRIAHLFLSDSQRPVLCLFANDGVGRGFYGFFVCAAAPWRQFTLFHTIADGVGRIRGAGNPAGP
jgi:hypothetical protein